MCGIAGIITKDSPTLGNDLINMLNELIHRGKDATGVAIYENRDTIDLRVSLTEASYQQALEEIIQKHKTEFYEWLNFRRSTPAINSLKKSLELIQKDAITSHSKKHQDINSKLVEDVTSQMISKIVSKFAMHLKAENTQANQSIKVMKDVFNLEPTES